MSTNEPTNPGTLQVHEKRELSGLVLDHFYKLESQFSKGGMSEIWRASHTQLPTARFLVKLLLAEFSESPAYIDALHREAALTRGLPGHSFTHVVHSGMSEGLAFYVMEEFEGEDLGQFLKEKYPEGMPAAEALAILEQILEAMSLAHAAGVIHRDLKPENVFVETDNKGDHKIRILDFGVAMANSEVYDTISKAFPWGTQQYMPPELHKANPDALGPGPALDVFAIGLIAYQMILGRHPFAKGDYLQRCKEGRELGLLHETRQGKRGGLNAALSKVLFSAVRFNPQERCPDVDTMLRIMRAAQQFDPENLSGGTIIGDYRILGKLGKGGMGAVYSAENIRRPTSTELVLKIVVFGDAPKKVAEELRQRFRAECESLHRLNHESIPYIYANDTHEGFPFLVMEKAPGDSLDRAFPRLLSIGGWDAVFKMARQVASAIDAVHVEGLIHRDLKPANIMIDPTTAKAMVVDFGIARLEGSQLTGGTTMLGTPGFSSPEQCLTRTVPASDQWSFAACFYALLTNLRPGTSPGEERGKKSAEEQMAAVLEAVVDDKILAFKDAPKITEVPAGVVSAISRAMSYDPADRFPSLTAFVDAMTVAVPDLRSPVTLSTPIVLAATPPARPLAIASAQSTLEDPPSVITESIAQRSFTRRYVPLVALALVLFVAVGYFVWGRGGASSASKASAISAVPMAAAEALPAAETPVPSPVESEETPPVATGVDIRVVTSYESQPIDGMEVQIGEATHATPFQVQLPAGPIVVTIADSDYAGTYGCTVSQASPTCDILLVRKREEPRRRKRATSTGNSGFIDLSEGAPKGKDSPFIFFNKDKKKAPHE